MKYIRDATPSALGCEECLETGDERVGSHDSAQGADPAFRLNREFFVSRLLRRGDVPHTGRSGQEIVQCRDDLRALAHRSGDTLDRARADIADREHAWAICLQQVAIVAGLGAGQHESLSIKRYAGSVEPIRVRIRPDKEENVADGPPCFSRCALPPADRL